MKRSPIRRRRRTKHQLANVEHADYIAWIHEQPCCACGYKGEAIQAAHVGRGGMGMKHGSDAEVIPLCGPHWTATASVVGRSGLRYTEETLVSGCHADHDQARGEFAHTTRAERRAWDELHIAVHRGRFEARNVGAQVVPF